MAEAPQTAPFQLTEPQGLAVESGGEPLAEAEQQNPTYRMVLRLGLPIAASLVVHLILLGILALTTWEVLTRVQRAGSEYHATLTEISGADSDALQWSQQPLLTSAAPTGSLSTPAPDLSTLTKLDLGLRSGTSPELAGPPTGLGSGADLGVGEARSGILGAGVGANRAGGGGTSLAGGGSGRAVGTAGMWGRSVTANSVVFVVDYSGSIIVAVDDLKRELKRSIGAMRPSQNFNVVLFYSEDDQFKTDSFAPGLQPADNATRQRFFEWLDRKSPIGRTDPLPAIRRALKMEPEAIFFLSDGDFEDKVVEAVLELNQSKSKICCLVFDELLLQSLGSGPPQLNVNARRMRQISEENGGWMVIVTARELRRAR